MPTHLIELLCTTEAFGQLDHAVRERIAASLTTFTFLAGDILAEQGQPGDALFLIVSGCVTVERSSPDGGLTQLGTYGPGTVVGELGLLTGHPRAALIAACEETTAARLDEKDFNQLCAEFPEAMEPLIQWMTARLQRTQIFSALAGQPRFKKLAPQTIEDFIDSLTWTELRTGELVFAEGETSDALYVIVSGRIRLTKDTAGKERTLTELGKGELLGEMALLTHQPRSATARATRDTQLARLDRSRFQTLLESRPQEWFALFTEELSARLRASNSPTEHGGWHMRPPAAIMVVPLSPAAGEFGRQLATALSAFGPTLHLTRARVEQMFSHRRSSVAAVQTRLVAWLNEQETQHRHVVLEADLAADADDGWTARCVRQADVILAVAEATQSPQAVALDLKRALNSTNSVAPSLVLLQTTSALHAEGTAGWRAALGAKRHFHVRSGNSNDIERIARSLNNKSVGLVLSGGFALGLSHIGVVQAMRDLSIPIDYIGGTSMGAVVSAACALDFPREKMLEVMHQGCAGAMKGDYTLPLVSLLTGKKVARELGRYLAGMDIEDFWLPFCCISASLVSARMVVHETGDALRSVLASCRAPAMFPPLGWNGDVLVDGGLVNNIPNDVVRERIGSGTLISANVSHGDDFSLTNAFDLHLSGWNLARRWISPFSREKIPTLLPILFRLISLGGVAQQQKIKDYADVYLEPPVDGFSFRDFHCGEQMATAAYPYARKMLEDWISINGRPWLGGRQE